MVQVDLPGQDPMATLFAEELGLVLEVDPQQEQTVLDAYSQAGLQPASIGSVAADASISIAVAGQPSISGKPLPPGMRCPQSQVASPWDPSHTVQDVGNL